MTNTMAGSSSSLLTVTQRIDDLGDVMRITLAAENGTPLPVFSAGSHIDLLVETGDGSLWRQYSICSDPADRSCYELGILKDADSRGGSETLHQSLGVGVELRIEGPRNHFPLSKEASKTVLFGGGIGITPMLAMAHSLHALEADFTLHYATRSAERTAFKDTIESFEFKDRIVLHHDDEGPMDLSVALPAPTQGTHIYVCGPTGFMDWIMDAARASGYSSECIHREYFSADVDTCGNVFEVYASLSDITVSVGAEDTIAKALARAGVRIEVKCEEGVCGTCVTEVLEGGIDHRDQFLTEEEREDADQICACCSRASGKRLVLEI